MAADKVSNQIRRLRFENGQMTQQQLADRTGVTRQTIIAIESGKYTPSLALAFKLTKVFAKQIEDVFEYNSDS